MTIRERAEAIAMKVFGHQPGLLVESLTEDIEQLCQQTIKEALDDLKLISQYKESGE